MPLRGLAAATLALVALLSPVTPTATAAGTGPAIVRTSPASDAATAAREARAVRREVNAMILDYLDAYGDRVTAAEREQMEGHRDNANRQLASVVVTTRRLSQLAVSSASRARVLTAARRAIVAHRRARAAAEASFASVRAILEPRLTLWEGLQALRDYDAMMGRFDRLGDRLDDIAREVR